MVTKRSRYTVYMNEKIPTNKQANKQTVRAVYCVLRVIIMSYLCQIDIVAIVVISCRNQLTNIFSSHSCGDEN